MRKRFRLPNGLEIEHLGAENAAHIYHEVFARSLYLRRGLALREGDTIVDVGANIGLFLLFLNDKLRDGRVLCVEPIPKIFRRLDANARLHNHLRLTLLNCGLGAQRGEVTFTYYDHAAASSTMFPDDTPETRAAYNDYIVETLRGRTHVRLPWLLAPLRLLPGFAKRLVAEPIRRYLLKPRAIACPVRTLSDIIDEYGIARIDLLKLDVESAEFEVIAGLRDEHWPRIRQAVIEIHQGEADARRMVALLEGHGFTVECEPEDPLVPKNFILYARRS